VPVCLILGQIALWYQARPLPIGKGNEAVVTLKLADTGDSAWPQVALQPSEAFEPTIGPIRQLSERQISWIIEGRKAGYQRLVFQVGDKTFEKELAIGSGIMRVSTLRPRWHLVDAVLNPWEKPFTPDSSVQSIEIEYPQPSWTNFANKWTSSADIWVYYWLIVSMIAAFCFRKVFNVHF
jgi:hypothetical protein